MAINTRTLMILFKWVCKLSFH